MRVNYIYKVGFNALVPGVNFSILTSSPDIIMNAPCAFKNN